MAASDLPPTKLLVKIEDGEGKVPCQFARFAFNKAM